MNVAQMVGENLRQARRAKGLTQQKVAEAMNKYQSDYSDYERGLIQLDYDKIVFLCRMFEITPNELFSFE
ncbi:MAG: helix-turn-helix transcriptional regulator [Clostridiales bacterium]|nr:helix-turn-helix transcriptional regulator [Clostridiales bacterium]